jgi:hypothetical protein
MTGGFGTVLEGMPVGSVARVGAGEWTVMRSTEFSVCFRIQNAKFAHLPAQFSLFTL